MEPTIAKVFAAALALLPLIAVALALGNLFTSSIASSARNPAAAPIIQRLTYVGMAMVEAIGLFALVVALIILFVI